MKNCRSDAPEHWRDIPGFGGMYQASTEGRIRRIWEKSGKETLVKPYVHVRQSCKAANNKALRVHLSTPGGKRVERTVLKLVADTFYPYFKGKRAVHRNGVHTDNSVRNIVFLSDIELGNTFGAQSSRRPVAKIDQSGEIIAVYTSARAAARENYVSYQTVMDRCNGKVRKEFALDGFSYRWDD